MARQTEGTARRVLSVASWGAPPLTVAARRCQPVADGSVQRTVTLYALWAHRPYIGAALKLSSGLIST